jgi:O-antigen/teichoic acid export membrane protein
LPDWPAAAAIGRTGALPAALIVGASIVVSVPLNLAMRIRLALGQGRIAFGWQAAGQVGALGAVILAAVQSPSLTALTAAAVIPPVVAASANTAHLWRQRYIRQAPPSAPGALLAMSRRIRAEGYAFFLLQLAVALAFMSDLPIIAATLGAERAGEYAVVQRVFSLVPLALTLLWAPLWPIYRQSLAKQDLAWIGRTFRWTTFLAVGFAFVGAGIIAIGFRPIGSLWLSTIPVASTFLLAGFVFWCTLEAAGSSVATLLNAASVLRYQVITSVVFATTCFAAKIWAVSHLGIDWLPWATVATYLLATGLPLALFWRTLKAAIRNGRY